VLKTSITFVFKLLCNGVVDTNKKRRESLKRELCPKYHSLGNKPVLEIHRAKILRSWTSVQISLTTQQNKKPFFRQTSGGSIATNDSPQLQQLLAKIQEESTSQLSEGGLMRKLKSRKQDEDMRKFKQ
jgi:hypothetical protein